MEGLVYLFEMFVGDMRIDLGRDNGSMSEHGLNAADIGTVHEQIGRKAVAQSVRMDILGNSGLQSVVFYNALDAAWGESETVSFGLLG